MSTLGNDVRNERTLPLFMPKVMGQAEMGV